MFYLVKTKNIDMWRPKVTNYNFKEDWIVMATALGFDNPKDFINFLYNNYSSVNVCREYYRSEMTKQCSGVAGLDIWFSVKKDADKFLLELNKNFN